MNERTTRTAFLWALLLVFCLFTHAPTAHAEGVSPDRPRKWEPAIQEFERQDAEKPRPPGGVVFVGSSSIRRWDLAKSFGKDAPLNRGFGGSRISDVNHFIDRTVLKHKPGLIVFYAGDNDVAGGASAEKVAERFAEFRTLVHVQLPKTKIVVLSIKPSPKRWHLAEKIQTANKLMLQYCQANDELVYVDVWTPMLDVNGQPRAELFAKDDLHLSDAGYELWTKLLKPIVAEHAN